MNILKQSVLATAITLVSVTAVAEVSMTVGMVSDYVYRGSELGDAGAYASVDYAANGFYAGVWTISDNTTANSLEYDISLGYETEISGVSVGLGYTAYEYSTPADSEEEFTLSLGMGPVSFAYSDGEDKNKTGDYDYDVMSLSADISIFTLTYGEYDADEHVVVDKDGSTTLSKGDYDWTEISTGTEIGAISLGVTLGSHSEGADYLVLDMSTAIDL
tara:strand:+ start:1275 stop:1925 length:651 start_codon:yes stop_codon:yes gene_type:complete